jgi:cell division protein FtsB
MRTPAKPPRNPRPFAAFFLSLLGSAAVLGIVLLYDGRVLELKKAKAEIRQLEMRIDERKRENAELKAAIKAANRGELPAEKTAREELHLVQPEDVVLLYPDGSLSSRGPGSRGPAAVSAPPAAAPTPPAPAASPAPSATPQ